MNDPTQYLANEAWLRPVEQLVLPALEGTKRVVGFTAPHTGAGVSTLARAAAETLTRSGANVLLIDFSRPVAAGSDPAWVPGEGSAEDLITRDAQEFDVLCAQATEDTRYLFNNGQRLKRALVEDLSRYNAIVADLPPLSEDDTRSINPLAVALACDQVLLVCANERTTRSEAAAAANKARAAGVKLDGLVWNAFAVPSLGESMARSVRRRLGFFPPLARWLERRLGASPFLNG